jgi:hypothetical protein
VTSYDNSTTTTCGYMASSLPYDPAIPGPSRRYLPCIPAGYPQYQPHPHPMSMQFNTGIGDIRVQSPTPWSAPYWPPHHTYPSYTETECRLGFRTGNISVCNGCRNKFDKQAKPPHDICVQHEEWRSYTSPTTNLPDSRFGNAYYHANPACIMSKWPSFLPQSLLISQEVKNQLQPEHKSLLASLFGIYI